MKKYFFTLLLFSSFLRPLHAEVIQEEHPVVILGGGVAGLTSAVYLARAGIIPLVITGPVVGGTITQSHKVQNWPGELAISGTELGERVKRQAEANGALLKSEVVVAVDLSQRPYLIATKNILGPHEQLKRYKAQSVIIALGATPHLLNVPGEAEYWSEGVYNCAVCDGSLYKDQVVAVVGGGDGALIEAEYLSNIAAKVHLFVRRDQFRAKEKQRLKEVLASSRIEVHYNTSVKEIKGDGDKVTSLILEDSARHTMREFPVDAVFLAIGSHPNTELFKGQLVLDGAGYIELQKHQQTSVEGVYAVGDVVDSEFNQVISAAGDAAKAAIQAQKFVASHVSAPGQSLARECAEKQSFSPAPVEIRSWAQFEQELKGVGTPVFVDFYSTHCGPCRTFSPLYEAWAEEYGGKIKFLKVNADHVPELFARFQVRGVPTLIIFDERGAIVRKSTGLHEIVEMGKRLEKIRDNLLISSTEFK
jgi:thioredoxin reductase (NADPH)